MQSVGSGSPLPRSRVRNVRGGSVGFLGLIGGHGWGAIKTMGGWLAAFGGMLRGFKGVGDVVDATRERVGGWAKPVEMRLPWPVLALLGVVALAMMGLMFQIGQHVAGGAGADRGTLAEAAERSGDGAGRSATESHSGQGLAETAAGGGPDRTGTVVAMGTVPTSAVGPGGERAILKPTETPGGSGGIALTDPRAVGLNYFVLATAHEKEIAGVRQLQKFLADHGLETYLDKANNAGLRQLVDVTQGFTRQELRNLEHATHEQRIRTLGKLWKQQHGGLGTDLSDIYRDRYDGPTE